MSAGVEEALGQMQDMLDESKRKDADIEQLEQVAASLREELAIANAKNSKFMEYEEIILDPDAEKQWQQVSIRSGYTFKQLVLRTQQLHHNTRPISIAAVVEDCLNFALSISGWRQVMKNRYSKKLDDTGGEDDA